MLLKCIPTENAFFSEMTIYFFTKFSAVICKIYVYYFVHILCNYINLCKTTGTEIPFFHFLFNFMLTALSNV